MSTNALFSYCFDGRDKYSFIIIIVIMHYAKKAAPQYVQETHLEMRNPNVTSFYFATPLAFNAPTEGFPWDDLRKILRGSQRMAKVQNDE